MNAEDFARRCLMRIAPTPDEERLADWTIFTAMLRATAAHVPTTLQFDDAFWERAQAWVATLETEVVDPAEDRRRLTPHAETLRSARAQLGSIHVLREMWAAFTDLFDAEERDTQAQALAWLTALADEYPGVYWRFNVYFHPLVEGERDAHQTPEYQRYNAHFRPPHTFPVNGGEGMERSIFPPGAVGTPPPRWGGVLGGER